MKKNIVRFLLFFFISSISCHCFSWSWGNSWNQGDFDIQKYAIIFDEKPAKPSSNPPANKIEIYGKDNGSGVTKIYALDSAGTETNILDSSTGAPIDATFITQTANGSLTNEQALSGLSTGLMQVTTTTGVISSVTTSAGVSGLIGDETGTGVMVFNLAPTFGVAGTDGQINIYSEQGATDYTVSLNPNAAMTSNAAFYLPADEPVGERYLTMGTDGVIDYSTGPTEADTLATVTGRGATTAVASSFTGGAIVGTTLQIPNSDDPDTTVTGQIALDTDGWLRVFNGAIQYGVSLDKQIDFTVQDAENLQTHAGRATQSALVWFNDTGMTLTLTSIRAMSDVDDYTFLLFKSADATDIGTANDVQIDSVACSTDGTSGYYALITSGFDSSTIEDGKWLIIQHVSGTSDNLCVHIKGYFDGNVN